MNKDVIPNTRALFSSSRRRIPPFPSKSPVDKQTKSTCPPFRIKFLMVGVKNMHSSSGWAVIRRNFGIATATSPVANGTGVLN